MAWWTEATGSRTDVFLTAYLTGTITKGVKLRVGCCRLRAQYGHGYILVDKPACTFADEPQDRPEASMLSRCGVVTACGPAPQQYMPVHSRWVGDIGQAIHWRRLAKNPSLSNCCTLEGWANGVAPWRGTLPRLGRSDPAQRKRYNRFFRCP